MKQSELFSAHRQRFKLNLIRRAHNTQYELGLSYIEEPKAFISAL